MPGITYRPINRRNFLTTSVITGFAAVVSPLDLVARKSPDFHHLALISDTHIPADENESYRGFFPSKNLQKIVGEVVSAKPEASIINGDLARLTGEKSDYKKLSNILKPISNEHPVLMTLGNHDDRDNFHEEFKPKDSIQQELENKHTLIYELPLIRIILLDSLMYVNKVPGFLGQKQREWLGNHLKESSDKPTFIFVHHTLTESDGSLLDYHRFFKIVLPHKKVKAVFHGHDHVYAFEKMDDLHVIGLPAVGYNFSDDQPVGWLDAKFSKKVGEFTLKAIHGNLGENGKTVQIDWR